MPSLMLPLLLVAALLSFSVVDAQRTFTPVRAITGQWSPRQKSNIEFVKKTTSFRDGLRNGAVTSLTNYFLLYGGQADDGGQNDVWASTNGASWVWVAGLASGSEHPYFPSTFPPTNEASHCQDSQFRQFRVGGHRDGVLYNDVWMSTDGSRWSEQTPAGDFPAVYLASMTSDASGALYLAGGILDLTGNPRQSTAAVWRSTNQGRTWFEMSNGYSALTGQPNSAGARGVSILLNSDVGQLIWLTGVNTGYANGGTGNPEAYYKDVWASTNAGRTFNPVSLNTPFGRRDDANAEITSGGLIVLAGGYSGTNAPGITRNGEAYNDVWVSPNGGYTWGLCVQEAEWDDRRYQLTLLDGDGYLWVMGGASASGNLDDMWKSTWSFSDTAATAARCRITVPACGAGLKCLPSAGNTLVASDGSGVYCDTCAYTFASQAAANTAVVAVLVVFVILFLLTTGALGYTYYQLRAAGAPSPFPLPASAQRWWNKETTDGAATNGSTKDGGDGVYQPLRIRDQM